MGKEAVENSKLIIDCRGTQRIPSNEKLHRGRKRLKHTPSKEINWFLRVDKVQNRDHLGYSENS